MLKNLRVNYSHIIKLFIVVLMVSLISCKEEKKIKDKNFSVTSLYKKANEALVTGNNDKAIKLYEKIIYINERSSDAYRILIDLKIQKGLLVDCLDYNQKLIELEPDKYQHYSKRAILLELRGENNESEYYYSKSRELLRDKEEYYWTKTDSFGMAVMLMEVCDSIRGRELLDKIIKGKGKYDKSTLLDVRSATHGDILKLHKLMVDLGGTKQENNHTENPISITE